MEVRYTVTRRGAPALLVNGYGFVARKRRGARVYWSCRGRRAGCAARASTRAGVLLACSRSHNHAPDAPLLDHHHTIESLIDTILH